MAEEIEYRTNVSARDLTRMLDELLTSEDFGDELDPYEVGPSQLRDGAVTVREAAAGLDPQIVSLIITFAGPPVVDVWRRLILPRLVRRWGIDIQEEQDGESTPN